MKEQPPSAKPQAGNEPTVGGNVGEGDREASPASASTLQQVFDEEEEDPPSVASWTTPVDSGAARPERQALHAALNLPQVDASSSDPAIEVYVRLNTAKRPASTDLIFIIGSDVAPFPQGGMTFVNVDTTQLVLDSKTNEDGYKWLGRLSNLIADAGFNVSFERSSALVSGPVIARLRIRRR